MPVSRTPGSLWARNLSWWGRGRRRCRSSSATLTPNSAALNPNPALAFRPALPASFSHSSLLVEKLPSKGESWNRQVGESGTGEGAPHRRAVFARSLGPRLVCKVALSRGGQCWNEAAPPAPTLLARAPGRGRGDTPGRPGCFSKPSYRKPSGSPGGDQLPTAKNPLLGAGCEAVCKPLHPGRVQ